MEPDSIPFIRPSGAPQQSRSASCLRMLAIYLPSAPDTRVRLLLLLQSATGGGAASCAGSSRHWYTTQMPRRLDSVALTGTALKSFSVRCRCC
jgi:hypothetical protein